MTPAALLEYPPLAAPPRIIPSRVSPERRTAAWILLAAMGLFAALATPFFLGQVYIADDLGEFHLPVRDFYARQLASGESFDWMPGLYGGFYISAEGQLGGYHPWHWFLYRTLPLGAAFNFELLASYPLLFAGTFLFFRRLIGRRDAALFGAIAFTFGGFSLLHFIHPNAIAVVAHLPWILWAIDVALTARNPRARVAAEFAIGILVASQLLLGYPQYVWFTLLAAVAFCAYQVRMQRTTPLGIVAIAVAIGTGFLIGAVQLLPTRHLLAESVRQAPDATFANSGSMHFLNLVQLVAPYLFQTRVVGQNTHELGLYIGAVPLVLCVWLLSHRGEWGSYRPLVKWLIAFTVLAILLAAGEFGGLYRLQSLVPLANRFRFPCRGIVLVQFCLAAMAAVGAAILFAKNQTARASSMKPLARSLQITTLLAIALAAIGPILWPDFVASQLLVWSGPVLIGSAALAVLLVERGVRGSVIVLILFTAVDLGAYGLSYSVYGRTANLHDYVAAIPLPPDGADHRIAAPDPGGKLRTGNRLLLAGLTRVDGYAGLEPAKRLDYSQRRSLQLAGVNWMLVPGANAASVEPTWLAITPTAPRARLVTRTLPVERLPEINSFDWNTATVDPSIDFGPSDNSVTPGKVTVAADAPGRITLDTDSDTRQLLVTTESFDPGWTANVDGQPVAVVRVNGDFLGCPVDGGKHCVRLEFRPAARQLGVRLSMLGLGLLVIAACIRTAVSRPTRVT